MVISPFVIGLGVLSAYHSKLFYGAFVSSLIAGGIFIRPVLAVGASASGAAGETNPLHFYFEGFKALPGGLQTAIYLAPLFFFMGRFATWFARKALEEELVEETREQRRARIRSEYGQL